MLRLFVTILVFTGGVSTSDTSQDVHSPSEKYLMSIWHNRLYVYSAAALLFGIWFSLKVALKNVSHLSSEQKKNDSSDRDTEVHVLGVKIFYGSQTGTAKGFANELSEEVKTLGIPAEVIDMKDYDPDDQLADEVRLLQREDASSMFSEVQRMLCRNNGSQFEDVFKQVPEPLPA
uniref:Flavodoxin-like domain-containing protein n=1 Tax=Stegastes partitus TaxID=144197 RepID=A0A3B5ALR3_9TELE